jgi:hypothetical protein
VSAPGAGFDATPAAIEGAAAQLAGTRDVVRAFSDGITAGITIAAGAAGEGPLTGALTALADGTRQRTDELGDETDQLARALRESAEAYRAGDGQVSFGGVTG